MLLPQYLLDVIECGTDEAGRGCLAGPVVAAAVIFPKNYQNPNPTYPQRGLRFSTLEPLLARNALSVLRHTTNEPPQSDN